MNYGTLLKNIVGVLAVMLITVSCSENVPERKVNLIQVKEVKLKNTVPSCCSKKPSRFSGKKVSKETLR
jgi:hypothetical protein